MAINPEAYRDPNRVPTLVAISNDGLNTIVPLEADPATGRLLVNSTGGAGGTQYTDGSATVTHPIGTIPVFDKSGTITAVSSTNPLPVSGTVNAVQSGTWTVQPGNTANTTAWLVGGASTGSTVPSGAFYQGVNAATSLPSAATAGNLTGMTGDKFGRAVVLPNGFRDIVSSQPTTISSSTSETTIVTAAASTFNDVVSVLVSNTSATATRVDIRDTTAGSVIWQIYVPAGDSRGISLTTPWPQTSVNTNWTATCGTSVADIRIAVLFVKNK